jgi:hypothetical protein
MLDVRSTFGHDLPRRLLIYAFAAALGRARVLAAARLPAHNQAIPCRTSP